MSKTDNQKIPWDLIVHTGLTDTEIPYPLGIQTPSDTSSPDGESRPSSELNFETEENTQKTEDRESSKLIEFSVNSTISQDQTGGSEQNINASLAALAQRLSKAHGIYSEKQTQNLQNLSGKTPTDPLSKDLFTKRSSNFEERSHSTRIPLISDSVATKILVPRNFSPSPTPMRASALPRPSSSSNDESSLRGNARPISNNSFRPPNLQYPKARIMRRTSESLNRAVAPTLSPLNYHYSLPRLSRKPSTSTPIDYYGTETSETDGEKREDNNGLRSSPPFLQIIGKPLNNSENDMAKYIPGSSSPIHRQFQDQALSATDDDLNDMQNILKNLTADEQCQMNASELDPIAYYFAYLKSRAKVEQRITSELDGKEGSSDDKDGSSMENSTQLPNEGSVQVPETKEMTVSERLLILQASIPEEEQIQLLEKSSRLNVEKELSDTKDSVKPLSSGIRKISDAMASSRTASPKSEVSCY